MLMCIMNLQVRSLKCTEPQSHFSVNIWQNSHPSSKSSPVRNDLSFLFCSHRMVLHIVCAVSVLRKLRLGLYSPTFLFAPPPLDHKVLEVIPSSLPILFITSIHQSAKQKNMLKRHIPYPSILHWKEHSWEGTGSPQTGTYGTAQ